MTDDEFDKHIVELGSIGDTTVRVVAEGPKAQWCADVLSEKFKPTFESIRQQVESWEAADE